ncbi:hypothetical protein PIB30_088878 [Stylosanthes scabra]|uniref:Uncharacterized protein n=1 Tax=Stylosanthes scabra TaxID=79078 RepID=A0ABU6VSZ4_9FABA|nr:hypothetical protein [Stylosanthes scabra]
MAQRGVGCNTFIRSGDINRMTETLHVVGAAGSNSGIGRRIRDMENKGIANRRVRRSNCELGTPPSLLTHADSLLLPTLSHRPTSYVPSQAARGLAKVAFVASYSLSPRVVPAARSSLMPSPALSSPPLQLHHPRPSQLELKLCAASSEGGLGYYKWHQSRSLDRCASEDASLP